MANFDHITSKFRASVTSANVWQQVVAMIQMLLASGATKQVIETEVTALINATALPPFFKSLFISLATDVIEALANPPAAPS